QVPAQTIDVIAPGDDRPADRQTMIHPTPDYTQTWTDHPWRIADDKAFIDAANEYNGRYRLHPGDPGCVTTDALRTWAMVESGGNKGRFESDTLQVNNPGDWSPEKAAVLHLARGQTMTPKASADAALEWRRYKYENLVRSGKATAPWDDTLALQAYNGN